MYPRHITQRIIELQAKGFGAYETKEYLDKEYGINIHPNTIYNHRKSPVGQEIIDELIRQQERAILRADAEDRKLAMHYRNELLKILLPQRIEAISKQVIQHIEEKRDVTILAEYVGSLDKATERDIQALRARKQVDTPQTNAETS